jgi:four helix bundle protein
MTDDSRQITQKRPARCFEDLVVYQKAFTLSLHIHKVSLKFPKIEQFALADQIRRCSKSICANIAEGYGKQKIFPAEFKRFLAMALGSSDEMRVWIHYCAALQYISHETANFWLEESRTISRMLQSLIYKSS